MSRQTFTWYPDAGVQLEQQPSVTVTKFGDGYELRTPSGINNNPENWQLSFSAGSTSLPAALAFIRARNATESFYWVTPLGETKIFVCRKWSATRNLGYYTMSFTFEQVFEA